MDPSSSLLALVGLLLLCMCQCWGFSNCTPRPMTNDLPPATYEINLNTTSVNVTGLDLTVEAQGHNVSDFNLDDLSEQSYARRMEFLRERKKQQRIVTIQTTILERLGISTTPNITSPQLTDDNRRRMARLFAQMVQTQTHRHDPDDIYAERVQSFYPSCSLPRNTDRDLWEGIGLFHIYYDIPSPRVAQGTSLTVSSAKLRLYKMEGPATEAPPTVAYPSHPENESDVSVQPCDERFRISVYQYTRPLKKSKRVKKSRKLIDSRMIAADFSGWLEFDVRSSLRDWLENTNKNLGFEIVLEDSLANTHNPTDFLQNMNCSEVNEPPFPRFMEDPINRLSDNESLVYDNETYPTLDLRTVKLLDSDSAPVHNEVTATATNAALRRKREGQLSCSDVDPQAINKTCCMIETYVSFADIGWSSVVSPSGYVTGVCIGGCTEGSSQHTCQPDRKSSLTVVTTDDGYQVKYTKIQDLITESCKCQLK